MIAPPSMEFDLSIEDFREPNNPSIDRRFLRPSSSPFLSFPLTLLPFHRYPSFKRHLLSHPVVVPLLLLPLFLPYDSMFALLCRVSPRYSNLARHLLYFFLFFFLFLSLWFSLHSAIIVANRRSLKFLFFRREPCFPFVGEMMKRKTLKIFDLWNIYRLG